MSPYKRHMAAVQSGAVTRTNVIGIRRLLNNSERAAQGLSLSRTGGTPATPEQVAALDAAMAEHHPTAQGALHEGGLKVLRNPRYATRWSPAQQRVIDGAARFDLLRYDRLGPRELGSVPVFRVISTDGEWFDFRNVPWQSQGDGPEVVS